MRGFLDFLVNNFGVYFESGSEVFLWFFNRAVAASWLILAVLVLRIFLKKAPRFITCALWGICALRLVLPFSLKSVLSLIPSAETVVPESIYDNRPQIDSGIPIIDEGVNNQITEQYYEGVTVVEGATLSLTSILAIIWIIGIATLLIYALVSYVKLKRRVKGAVELEKGVFECAGVTSPFILGIFSSKIYLPLNMDEETKTYVLAHERAHLSRGDHIFKPLGFVILSLYWFSPLVWVAYILFCRDIEVSCDERVVSKLEKSSRANYAQALLDCAVNQKSFSACPIAFGEVSIKDRVKSALNYKKPMLWVIVAAIITVVAVAVCFLTDPIKSIQTGTSTDKDNTSSSITSSEISKDETSSDKNNVTSKDENSSPTPVRPPLSSKEEKPTSSKENTSSEATTSRLNLPYYMPENNPALVSISGKNAAIPTPISYTDTPAGEYVEYGITTTSSSSSNLGIKTHVATIRTYEELCKLYEWDSSEKKWSGEDYSKRLSQGIFNHSVVFVLLRGRGTLDTKIGNVQVTKRNGQLCIHQKLIREGRLGASGYDRQFIIVPKSELEDVNSVVLYYDISILSQEYFPFDLDSYDMSYGMGKGEKIFEDNSEKITGFTKFPIVRIDSRDELLEFADKIYPYFNLNSASSYSKCFNDLLKKCNKEFFSKQTLFMMYYTTGSSNVDYSIMGVGKKGGALTIDLYYDNHGTGDDVMSCFVKTIEVDKETAKSLKTIDVTLIKI